MDAVTLEKTAKQLSTSGDFFKWKLAIRYFKVLDAYSQTRPAKIKNAKRCLKLCKKIIASLDIVRQKVYYFKMALLEIMSMYYFSRSNQAKQAPQDAQQELEKNLQQLLELVKGQH